MLLHVGTSLLTSCKRLYQQVDIGMRSHGLRQDASLLQVVNRLVDCQNLLPTWLAASCFNKSAVVNKVLRILNEILLEYILCRCPTLR